MSQLRRHGDKKKERERKARFWRDAAARADAQGEVAKAIGFRNLAWIEEHDEQGWLEACFEREDGTVDDVDVREDA